MKILFVHETCGYHGGVEQHVADVCQGLAARGHSCHLAYGRRGARDAAGFAALFTSAAAVADLAPDAPGRRDAPRLAQLARRLGPDVIYLHKVARLPEDLPPGPRVARMIHDHDLCCPRRHRYHPLTGRICDLPAGWWCALEGAFLGRSPEGRLRLDPIGPKLREIEGNRRLPAVLVGSRYMRRSLIQQGFDPQRIHRLPPVGPWAVEAPDPLPEAPRILFVGQLIRGKGVDLLLDALARLSAPFEATLVGAGNAEGALRAKAAELGLAHRIRFEGWVDHAALDRLYRRARVVVVPSRWPEPFGMVGLEAMHHARPVVAFDVGGISDWLTHGITGLTAPEQDVGALAAALDHLLADTPAAQRMGEAGRRQVLSQFRFEDHLDRLEAILSGASPDHAGEVWDRSAQGSAPRRPRRGRPQPWGGAATP